MIGHILVAKMESDYEYMCKSIEKVAEFYLDKGFCAISSINFCLKFDISSSLLLIPVLDSCYCMMLPDFLIPKIIVSSQVWHTCSDM